MPNLRLSYLVSLPFAFSFLFPLVSSSLAVVFCSLVVFVVLASASLSLLVVLSLELPLTVLVALLPLRPQRLLSSLYQWYPYLRYQWLDPDLIVGRYCIVIRLSYIHHVIVRLRFINCVSVNNITRFNIK